MPDGSTRTVVYDRWYLAEIERRERPKRATATPPPRLDKREPDPRRALATAADRRGVSLAALSRMLDQPVRYLDRFVREGRPLALPADHHVALAAFFGLDERGLGVRLLWVPMAPSDNNRVA